MALTSVDNDLRQNRTTLISRPLDLLVGRFIVKSFSYAESSLFRASSPDLRELIQEKGAGGLKFQVR
jgi:hypothetical protein